MTGALAIHVHGVVLPLRRRRTRARPERSVAAFDLPRGADARTLLDGGFLLPGLVDAHAHLALISPAPPGSSDDETARANARRQLEAGVLAIREPWASPMVPSVGISPDIGLPRTVTAGRFLTPPRRYFASASR